MNGKPIPGEAFTANCPVCTAEVMYHTDAIDDVVLTACPGCDREVVVSWGSGPFGKRAVNVSTRV